MTTVIIRENPLDPKEDKIFEGVENVRDFLCQRFRSWPKTNRLYRGSVSDENEIPIDSHEDVVQLGSLEGTIYCVTYPAFVAAVAAVGIATSAVVNNRSRRNVSTEVATQSTQPSPNNEVSNFSLSQRSNTARLNQRIPDIYGVVPSIPDAVSRPYKVFEGNTEVEYAYYVVGRGDHIISELRDGDTEPQNVEVYGPFTSPNIGAKKLQIGPNIEEPLSTATFISDFDALRLEAGQPEVNPVGFPGLVTTPATQGTRHTSDLISFETLRINFTSDAVFPGSPSASGGVNSFTLDNTVAGLQNSPSLIAAITPLRLPGQTGSNLQFNITANFYGGVNTAGGVTVTSFVANGDYYLADIIFGTVFNPPDPPIANLGVTGDGILAPPDTTGIVYVMTSVESVFTRFATNPPPVGSSDKMVLIRDSGASWQYSDGVGWFDFNNIQGSDRIVGRVDFDAGTGTELVYPTVIARASDQTVQGSDGIFIDIDNPSNADPVQTISVLGGELAGKRTATITNPWPDDEVRLTVRREGVWPTELIMEDFTADFFLNQSVFAVGGITQEIAQTLADDQNSRGQQVQSRGEPVEDNLIIDSAYRLEAVTQPHFGDVTTIYTRTVATTDSSTERQLKCTARRIIPRVSDDGSTITGTQITSNFAEIIIALSLDKFIGNRSLRDLDIANFRNVSGEVSNYFGDNKSVQFNYTFDDGDLSYEETIALVAEACFCTAFRQGNRIKLDFERKTDISVLLFNHRNKLPGSEQREVIFGKVNDYDSVELEYNGADGEPMFIYIPTDRTGANPQTVKQLGVTSKLLAHWHAYRLWNRLCHQKETVEFDALQEANMLVLNERIQVADNTRGETWDGEIRAKDGAVLTLSQPFDFDPTKAYTIFLQTRNATVETAEILQGQDPYSVVLANDVGIPIVTDPNFFTLTNYEIVENSSTRKRAFLVDEKEPQSNFITTITAVNYDDRYYENDQDFNNGVVDTEGNDL